MMRLLLMMLILAWCAPSYAYWNCAFPYRTTIEVEESTGSNLTDYQVQLQLNASRLNPAYSWSDLGQDIRILDSDDETELEFWVESWDGDSEQASIWIRLPSLTANQLKTIYLYYGNEFAPERSNVPFTFTEPGIKFHTRNNQIDPDSLEEADNLFALAGDNTSGYGCTIVDELTGITNASEFGSGNNFIAYSETFFEVTAGQTGLWSIRYGSDFGYGGGLYVDGEPLEEQWTDNLWWNENWSSPDVLSGSVELSEGYHRLEVIGAEDCCDGGLFVQYLPPNEVTWSDYSVNNINIRSRVCPISEPVVRYTTQDTATCPAATASYRLDSSSWTIDGDVIDQTGSFPGGMLGGVDNVVDGKFCSAANIVSNSVSAQVDAIQTGVDLDDDLGLEGSIAFWIRYDSNWDATGSTHAILDATDVITGNATDKYFLLQKEPNGRLTWRFEDSSDTDYSYTEAIPSTIRLADVWYHITLTYDYNNNEFKLYVNDELVIDANPSTTGFIQGFTRILFGDNYDGNFIGPGPSSNADFDEINLFGAPITLSQIRGLLTTTRSCQPATTQFCANVFPDGIATAGGNTSIDFGFNAQLLNNPDTQLATDSIQINAGSSLLSCESANCSDADEPVGVADNGNFQRGNARRDVNVGFFQTETIGAFDDYDNVSTSFLSDLTFSNDNFSVFFIDTLNIASFSTVTFEAGTYWIDEMSVQSGAEINVSEGPVRLFINRDVQFASDSLVNSPATDTSGSVSELLLYAYRDVSFSADATFSGALYSRRTLELGSDAQVYGAVTARDVVLQNQASVNYRDDIYDGLTDISWCEGNVSSLGSLRMSSPAFAINCLPVDVVITAYDINGDLMTDFTGTINLSSTQAHGDWFISSSSFGVLDNGVANDGVATYTMSADDNGQVTLQYKNTYAEETEIIAELSPAFASATTEFNPAGFVLSTIPTQTAGLSSSSHIVRAVETDQVTGTCQPLLLQDQTIQLAATCINPDTCSSQNVEINGQAIAMNNMASPITYSDITLNFGDGTSDSANFSFQYDDVGELQLLARYDLRDSDGQVTGNVLQGASNTFVNIPAGFCVRATEANNECTVPGLTSNCSAFKIAGSAFDIEVSAKTYGDGSPDYCSFATTSQFNSSVNLRHDLVSPTITNGGRAGDLNLSDISLLNGEASESINITEMGVFQLTAGGNTYLAQSMPSSQSQNIGRFFPKDFFIENHTPPLFSDGNTGFTYIGQLSSAGGTGAIGYLSNPSLDIRVRGASNQNLQNYLPPFSSALSVTTLAESQTQDASGTAFTINTWFSSGAFDLQPGNAVITYDFNAADGFAYGRDANGLVAPFDNDIELVVTEISDAQGISLAQAEYRLAGSGGEIRFGRLRIDNAYGVESQPIDQRFFTEYYDGSRFEFNALDSGTPYDVSALINLAVTDVGDSSNPLTLSSSNFSFVAGSTGSFISGEALGRWTATINGEYGRYEFDYDAPSWLEYNWDDSADGSFENPSAEVSFGQYRGHDRIIYWKEINY